MKYRLLLFIVIVGNRLVYGQSVNKEQILKAIAKSSRYPRAAMAKKASGTALIRFTNEKDSILIETLYCSEKEFDGQHEIYLVNRLNPEYKDAFPKGVPIVVPIYFQFGNAPIGSPRIQQGVDTDAKIRELKIKKPAILLASVTIIGYLHR